METTNNTNQNTPPLRFPEFTAEWEKKKLGEVATNKSGKYNPEKESSSIKCIELEHLSSETGQLIGYIDGKKSGSIKNTFEKGDVLFGKLRPYLKKYLLAPFDGVCSSEIWVLKGMNISNDFLYRIVQTDRFIDLANQSSGSKMPRADWNVIEKGIFSFPSLPEQAKIASFLTAVDEKIQALKQKKNGLEQYKKGVMQRIFCLHHDSLDVHDEHDFEEETQENTQEENQGNQENHKKSRFRQLRFRQDDGSDFPDWEVKKLGEVFYSEKGKGISKNKIVQNGKYECVLYGELYTKYNEVIFEVESKTNEEDGIKSKVGDLLIPSSTTTTGIDLANVTALNKNDVLLGGDITVLRSTVKINNIFYAYYLSNHKKDEIASYAQGSTIVHLYYSHIKDMIIDIPCLEEQEKIANFLSAIDEKINHTQTQIEKTERWKKGLLQQMFV